MNRNMRTKRALGLVLVIVSILLIGTQDTMADLVKRPSDMVHLEEQLGLNDEQILNEVDDGGAYQGKFLVPNRYVLVIRTVTISPGSPGAGLNIISLRQQPVGGGPVMRMIWTVPNDRITQLQFSPGIVIAPRHDVRVYNYGTSAGSVYIDVFGYLTRDK